jgi:hypothetical protein
MPRKELKDDDQVAQVASLIAGPPARGRGKRSPLWNWLMAHHDAFATMLSQQPASWEAIANGLGALGLTDGKGSAPTAERVRKAWWMVRHEAASGDKAPSPAPSSPHGQSHGYSPDANASAQRSPLPLATTAGFDPDAVEPDTVAGPEFRPARPRNWTRPASSTPSQEPGPPKPASGQEYDTVLRQLMERASARSLPMPQIPTAEDE